MADNVSLRETPEAWVAGGDEIKKSRTCPTAWFPCVINSVPVHRLFSWRAGEWLKTKWYLCKTNFPCLCRWIIRLSRFYVEVSAPELKDLYKARGEEPGPHFTQGKTEAYRSKMSSQVHPEGLLQLMLWLCCFYQRPISSKPEERRLSTSPLTWLNSLNITSSLNTWIYLCEKKMLCLL